MEPNVYYVPIALEKNVEQKMMEIKNCCRDNVRTEITLKIKKVICNLDKDESFTLFFSPLYYNKTYSRRVTNVSYTFLT